MKTIGLIGGMTWVSSIEYYRIINETVKEKLGGLHSAKSIMYSVDFAIMEDLMNKGNWKGIAQILTDIAINLEKAGADLILICTNTMHKLAEEIEEKIKIPLIHIADAAAEKVKEKGLKKIGLLGTKFTMEQDFYKGRMNQKYGLEVLVPEAEDRIKINDVIFKELGLEIIKESSKKVYLEIIQKLINKGVEGIVLGCTEIPLLIKQEDVSIPVFNTTEIHAKKAVDIALK